MKNTKTEIIGFCEAVIDFVQTNEAALAGRGANIGQVLGKLRAETVAAVNAGSEHETLKAKLRDTTAKTNAAVRDAYYGASSTVDMVAGMYGKTTEMGRQVARLRSRINRYVRKSDGLSKAASVKSVA